MKRRQSGWTLIEAMVVLALAGILMSAAAPSYQEMMRRHRLRTATNDLVAAIDLTRSQAIARGGRVLMVPLEPSGEDWRLGWAVFIDDNGNRRPDAGERLIYRHDALADGITVQTGFTSDASPAYLAYNAAGRACNAGNSLAARWGTLSLAQGENARHIKINMLGRVRVCDPALDRNCTGVND